MRSISSFVAIVFAALVLNVNAAYATTNQQSCQNGGGVWIGQVNNGGHVSSVHGTCQFDPSNNTTTTSTGGTGVGVGVGIADGGDVKNSGNSSNTNLNGAVATGGQGGDGGDATIKNNTFKGGSADADAFALGVQGQQQGQVGINKLDSEIENKNYNQDTNVNAVTTKVDTTDVNVNGQDQDQDQSQSNKNYNSDSTEVEGDIFVSDDDTVVEAPKIPVATAAAQAAAYCGTGGASAQWQNFGVSLGQQRDDLCGRALSFHSHLQLAQALAASNNDEGLLRAIEAGRGVAKAYKGKTPDAVGAAAAEGIRARIAAQNALVNEELVLAKAQLTAIDRELDSTDSAVRRGMKKFFGALPFPLNALSPR